LVAQRVLAEQGKPIRRTAKTVTDDIRQLELLGEARPDPLAVYYAQMKRLGMVMHIDAVTGQISVFRERGAIPRWAANPGAALRDRIAVDLLRAEHGIEPPIERYELDNGATLVRLPAQRDPALEPPVAHPRDGRVKRNNESA
jgi:hypothetical protein